MSNSSSPAKRAKLVHAIEIGQHHQTVVVLDYGSQYTQLIARRVRELGIFSLMMPGDCSLEQIFASHPKAIILSGGPNSVHVADAPRPPNGFFERCALERIAVLGVCYGMQLLVHLLGGEVKPAEGGEYGRMEIQVKANSRLLCGDAGQDGQLVWMSHGDEAIRLPEGFDAVATSQQGAIVAVEDEARQLYGVQFHPEVRHTQLGTQILSNFLLKLADVKADWTMQSLMDEQISYTKSVVGDEAHAICALSGGVDSTVAATLVHKAIGDRLHCVFVDNGLLRHKEAERVMATFQEHLHLPVTCVTRDNVMLAKLEGVSDPERKRKIIGADFIEAFTEEARRLEGVLGGKPAYLVQGTLYPDVIESCPPPGSSQKHSHTIKSHHNVGGLPEKLGFQLVEPLRELFKDEVRVLGRLMGVPEAFVARHPFPGPGLAVRVLGAVGREQLNILRDVDEIFISTIREFGLYDEIWQAFAVFLPVRTVGVQGDQRTHSHVVALRAVTSADGMTADWYQFQPSFLQEVSTRICNQVRSINRVVYDVTSKPPATIEWE